MSTLDRLLRAPISHPRSVLALIGLATLFFAIGGLGLRVDSSIESMIVEHDPDRLAFERWKEIFGSDEVVSIALPFEDALTAEALDLQRRIAERLLMVRQTTAMLTTFNEADMSAVIALRKEFGEAFQKKYGVKLGFMSFFVKAVVQALKEIPELNAEIRDNHIVYHRYYDIGIAVGGGEGLVVPVIRDADRLSFAEIEQKIADFAERARTKKLKPEELMGGTFTITNGGIYGSLNSTPLLNPPQVGILGMHAIQERPVVRDGQVVIRPMMYLALSYDHRIVDGREAVTFLRRVKELIENPARLLLEV